MDTEHARALLGVNEGASTDEIKRAYRGLMRTVHPDKHGGDPAAARVAALANDARDVLLAAADVWPRSHRSTARPPWDEAPEEEPFDRGPEDSWDEDWWSYDDSGSRGGAPTDGAHSPSAGAPRGRPRGPGPEPVPEAGRPADWRDFSAHFLLAAVPVLAFTRSLAGWASLVIGAALVAVDADIDFNGGTIPAALVGSSVGYWIFSALAVAALRRAAVRVGTAREQSGSVPPAAEIAGLVAGVVLAGVFAYALFATYWACEACSWQQNATTLQHPAAEAAEAERLAELWPAGRVFRDACDGCPEMAVIPAGRFMMGSPRSEEGRFNNEGPRRRVSVRSFALGVKEVTFDEWAACVHGGGCGGRRPHDQGWGWGARPVTRVSWEDAQAYVSWLSAETGAEYRLPSESEWEYAARAGTTTPFHTGATISTDQANYGRNRRRTTPVGSFAPNAFGLYDVHGNVWEWVEDCLHDRYRGAPSDGTAWLRGGNCGRRVLRGGSWFNDPRLLRSGARFWDATEIRGIGVGFRVARTLG